MRLRFGILLLPLLVSSGSLLAQSLQCQSTVTPTLVRSEGLTEQMGDIMLQCTGGAPSQIATGTVSVFLSVPITNKVDSSGQADAILAIDSGAGPVISPVRPHYQNSSTLSFPGVTFQNSPTGALNIHVSNVRGAASYIGASSLGGQQITASLSVNGLNLFVTSNTYVVGVVQRGLYNSYTSRLICSGYGTPDVTGLGLASAVAMGGAYSTVRVTEGFPSAFAPRSDYNLYNADFGTRIVARFSGVPAGAHLFVPNAIAGNDALQETSAGDYGLIANGGAYTPGSHALLLAFVANADASGGGSSSTPVFNLSNLPNAPVSFDSMSEIIVQADGTATAAFEVLDANPAAVESATIPAFVYMPRGLLVTYQQITENVSFGPVSNVVQTGNTQPVPRYVTTIPTNDCGINGDCAASYFPKLQVNQTVYDVSMTTLDGVNHQYVTISNGGSGNFLWNATVQYLTNNASGYPWLQLTQSRGLNQETVGLNLVPGNLASGVYDALVTIDGGPIAGLVSIRVTMRLSYQAPVPLVLNVVNDASQIGGFVVPGSRVDILGDRLSGNNIGITFNGIAGTVLSTPSATELVVQTPYGLDSQNPALIYVTIDGSTSNGILIPVADSAPAIYGHNIVNEDGTANGPLSPARTGSTIQVFTTGLPVQGVFTGRIHDRTIDGDNLVCAGPAPSFVGMQLLQMVVPSDLPTMTTSVYACGGLTPDSVVCSEGVDITLFNPPVPE